MAITLTAGESLAQYDVVYIGASFKMYKTDSNLEAKMPGITMCQDATIAGDATGAFYPIGSEITNESWAWDPGLIYPSGTPGAMTQTVPATSGDQVQAIGFATAATKMVLYPQLVLVEVA